MKIKKVRWDCYLVRRAKPEKTARPGSKIEVADQYQERPRKGEVLLVGLNRGPLNRFFARRSAYSVGDWVMFGPHAGVPVPDEFGADLVIIPEDEILALLG